MTWAKDLGNVKGDKGDIYVPKVINNANTGYTTIQWTKKAYDGTVDEEMQQVHIPVYVPNYDPATGNLVFELNTTGTFKDISSNVYHIRGETGATGTSTFAIEHFTGDINNIPAANRNPNAFYVESTSDGVTPEVYIYDQNRDIFVNLEGFTFDKYYLKTETYSATEIDSMFTNITTQQKIIQQLLDIEETVAANDELGD